jgi:hypothetical protein
MDERNPLDYETPPPEPKPVGERDFWVLIVIIAVLLAVLVLMMLV